MAKSTGAVTLRGRFAPGDKVELVQGEFPDPMLPDAIKTATVSKDGSVKFDGLDPGASYVVRDKDRTRQAQVTARGAEIGSALVPKPSLEPEHDPPQTPVEDVPRVVHSGPRGTRQLSTTRGDKFAGEDRETKPQQVADVESVRQADFAGPQASDTPIGEAVPVVVEEVEVEHLHRDVPDPVSAAAAAKPGENVSKHLEARAATPEEIEKAVKPPRKRAAKKAAKKRPAAKKRAPARKATARKASARKSTSKRSK